jgi:hypothetical protein
MGTRAILDVALFLDLELDHYWLSQVVALEINAPSDKATRAVNSQASANDCDKHRLRYRTDAVSILLIALALTS